MLAQEKIGVGEVEAIEHGSVPTPEDPIANLTNSHKEYLLSRHGTLELDPLPSQDPADPLNWPRWKASLSLQSEHLESITEAYRQTLI